MSLSGTRVRNLYPNTVFSYQYLGWGGGGREGGGDQQTTPGYMVFQGTAHVVGMGVTGTVTQLRTRFW
jgi:hypothetical protein